MENSRPGTYYPVYENDRGTYVMSSRDLCMIEHLDKLADAGVTSFKIEGRMKGINYVAGVVKTYREAVDSLRDRPFIVKEQWMQEISMSSNRGFTTGMFFGKQPDEGYNHDDDKSYTMTHELVGVVQSLNNGNAVIALRNNLSVDDNIEFLTPGLENQLFLVTEMQDMKGNPAETGRNEESVSIPAIKGIRENDLIRRTLKQNRSNS
jgi:putative protease